MKILRLLSIIFYGLAIILIPISFFNFEFKTVIAIIGYSSLILGGIFMIIYTVLSACKKRNENNDSFDKE